MKLISRSIIPVVLAAVGAIAPAEAGYIYDIGWNNPFFRGQGQIELATATGNSIAGVNALSLAGNIGINGIGPGVVPWDITPSDIISIAWSIDSAQNLALSFTTDRTIARPPAVSNCIAFAISGPAAATGCQGSLGPISLAPGSTLVVGTFTSPGGNGQFNTIPSATLVSFTPAPDVPEPGTLILLGVGIVGLAAMRRRSSRTQLPR